MSKNGKKGDDDEDDLFKWFDAGREARDEGIDKVLDNTPGWWRTYFEMAWWHVARQWIPFDAEDVRLLCGDPPNDPNAFGGCCSAIITRSFKLGIIREVEVIRTSRTTSHKRRMPRYRLIWDPDEANGLEFGDF